MAATDGYESTKKPTLKEKITNVLDKYGIFALFILIITACIGFITWNAEKLINRADKQAETNYKLGQLESRVSQLEKEFDKKYILTTSKVKK